MACAHSFGELCRECYDGLAKDYNNVRQRVADLEAALRELVRLNAWKDELDAMEEADPHEGADGRFGAYWQQDAVAWAAARALLEVAQGRSATS